MAKLLIALVVASAVEHSTTASADYSAAVALYSGRGNVLGEQASCPGKLLVVREWRLCLPALQAHISRGECLAYIFGYNTNSPLADVLATRGCEVRTLSPLEPETWPCSLFAACDAL